MGLLVVAAFAFIALSVVAKSPAAGSRRTQVPWYWALPLVLVAGALYYFTRLN